MNQHALKLTELPIYRGNRLLIKNVSFQLPHGHYLEVQGQNGCGKTSLLRTLATLQSSTGRSVFYFGHQSGFRPELNVAEQLALALQMHGVDTDRTMINTILKRVGLAHHSHAPIRRLSQGQLRRLMLAVMANSGCRLWLIDEPFNALDAAGIELLKELLAEHFDQHGSALIATHRSLDDVIPALTRYAAGKLCIAEGQAQFFPIQSAAKVIQFTDRQPLSNWSALAWVWRREFKLLCARPQEVIWPAIFYWMTLTLFPFGLGTDTHFLAQAAAGIFWISALLASLMGTAHFFHLDYENGVLSNLYTARVSLTLLTLGKMLAGWVFIGIPLSLASIPLALLYGLNAEAIVILFVSLLLGSISLVAFCCLFAALGLMARQAQIIICLLAFPVFVPLVIFGASAITGAQSGIGFLAPLIVLANLALLSMIALPKLTGRVLALALE